MIRFPAIGNFILCALPAKFQKDCFLFCLHSEQIQEQLLHFQIVRNKLPEVVVKDFLADVDKKSCQYIDA